MATNPPLAMLGEPLSESVPVTPPAMLIVLLTAPEASEKLCTVDGMPVYATDTTLLGLLEYQ